MYYDSDKFQLSPKEILDLKVSIQIPSNAVFHGIKVYGYCDDVGSTEYNEALSLRRAKAMAAYLRQLPGLEKVPISSFGNGEIQIEQPGDTATMRSVNRRTEVWINYSIYPEKKDKPVLPDIPNLDELEVGEKMVLDNILFEGGLRDFLFESYPALDDLVNKLKASPTVKVRIIGHVCCTGGPDGEDLATGKKDLSVIRAQTVYEYLIDHGIAKERLSYIGKGGSEPLGGDIKYDRRVELEILEK
jgi:outer membrane protein OmpA-like peptidoglycan-associated protein